MQMWSLYLYYCNLQSVKERSMWPMTSKVIFHSLKLIRMSWKRESKDFFKLTTGSSCLRFGFSLLVCSSASFCRFSSVKKASRMLVLVAVAALAALAALAVREVLSSGRAAKVEAKTTQKAARNVADLMLLELLDSDNWGKDQFFNGRSLILASFA